MVFFLPVNFPSIVALDQGGLKLAVLIGISLTTIGLVLRIFIDHSFTWVLIGQTLMAFGQPFTYNAPAKLSTNWFSYQERAIATMVGTSANILGITLGFLLPSLFIDDYVADTEYTVEEKLTYKSQTRTMLIAFAIFSVCILMLIIFFFKEKPPTPPPADPEEKQQQVEILSLWKGLRVLGSGDSRAVDYKITLVVGTLLLGTLANGYAALIGQFMLPFGIDDVSFVSWAGVAYNVGGLIGQVIASFLVCMWPKSLQLVFLIIAATSLLTFGYFFLATLVASKANIILACVLVGIANLPVYTVSYELVVQQTLSLGVGEGLSCGLINLLSNMIGWVCVLGLTPLLDKVEQRYSILSMAGLTFGLGLSVIFTISLVLRNQMKRDDSCKPHKLVRQ